MPLVKLEEDYQEPYDDNDDGLGAARGLMVGLALVLAGVVFMGSLWVLLAIL